MSCAAPRRGHVVIPKKLMSRFVKDVVLSIGFGSVLGGVWLAWVYNEKAKRVDYYKQMKIAEDAEKKVRAASVSSRAPCARLRCRRRHVVASSVFVVVVGCRWSLFALGASTLCSNVC